MTTKDKKLKEELLMAINLIEQDIPIAKSFGDTQSVKNYQSIITNYKRILQEKGLIL